ncbi:hypothetical protein MMC13_005671 [Lambiella insularis]|nr:hypothetical protein [Lambiella insularis]
MDSMEPDQTPFAAVTAQTSRFSRRVQDPSSGIQWLTHPRFQAYQAYLDKSTPYVAYRWSSTGALLVLFLLRIVLSEGWYIVCYSLGIYLLNLFLAFLQPKFDPSLSQDDGLEDGDSVRSPLPIKRDEEFRPFIRRLPEFKFWHSATRAITIAFACTWSELFNVPVFWPVLVVYWIILFTLTSKLHPVHVVQKEV